MSAEMTLPLTGRLVYPLKGRSDAATSIKWYITAVDTDTKTAHIDFYFQFMYREAFAGNSVFFSADDYTADWYFHIQQTSPVATTQTISMNEAGIPSFNYPDVVVWEDHFYDEHWGYEIDEGYEDWECISFAYDPSTKVPSRYYGFGSTYGWKVSGDFVYSNTGSINLKFTWQNASIMIAEEDNSVKYYDFFGGNYTASDNSNTSFAINLLVPSRVEIPNGYLGDVLDARIVNDVTDPTMLVHDIQYEIGSVTDYMIEDTSLRDFQWTVPMSLLSEYPEGASYLPCKITCSTYDINGVLVGKTIANRYYFLDTYTNDLTVNTKLTAADDLTVSLTKDENKLIRFISTGKVDVEIIAHAEVSRVIVSNNGVDHIVLTSDQITEKTYPGGLPNVYKVSFTIPAIESGYFSNTAVREDGFIYVSDYDNPLIPYWKLTIHPHKFYFNPNGIVSCQIDGLCFHDEFSTGVMNEPQIYYRSALSREELEVEEWRTDDNEMIWGDNLYTTEFEVSGYDIQRKYYFEFKIVDKCMEVLSQVMVVIGKPVYDWNNESFHFGVPVESDREMIFKPDFGIAGTDPEGKQVTAFVPCDSVGNTVLGYGNYQAESGNTMIYGNEIDVFANNGIYINGRKYDENRILWQGVAVLAEGDAISLSERISSQPNGIVLVFSLYNTSAQDTSFNTFFVSKKQVELFPNCGHSFIMAINAGFSSIGAKYLYFTDTTISGHEGNTSTGTNSGISFKNNNYVLRMVIGV